MTNVIKLDVLTKLDIKADEMLREIAKEQPKNVFVISWPEDGSNPSYHSSTADIPVILMQLNGFIHKYYNGDFGE